MKAIQVKITQSKHGLLSWQTIRGSGARRTLWTRSISIMMHIPINNQDVIEECVIDDMCQDQLVCFVLIFLGCLTLPCFGEMCLFETFPAGLPLEILSQDFWVAGSTVRAETPQFLGKEIYSEILQCTNETAYLYALRACEETGGNS